MQPDPVPPPRELADRFRRALQRMPAERGSGQAVLQAAELFRETFGAEPASIGDACGFVPVAAEHTHYFPGFGLLARLPWGVAVAVRTAAEAPAVTTVGADAARVARLVDVLRARLAQAGIRSPAMEVAVAATLDGGGEEAVLGAIARAFVRTLEAPAGPPLARVAAGAVEEVLGRPYGPAYILAAEVDADLALIDAGTSEAIEVDRPEGAGLGLLEFGKESLPDLSVFWERAAVVEYSLEQLRDAGFQNLSSLRKLEHQDLPGALNRIDASARPLIRHLVTEDRRVTRMVAALKRADPQILGAMLMMSFASQREDLRSSIPLVDFAVGHAEAAEGIYGARMAGAGYGGRILVVGRPFLLPGYLDALQDDVAVRYHVEPRPIAL
jgi:galactokinase